jgi:hypothetical protein
MKPATLQRIALTFACISSIACYGQTRKILHKSHSGSMSTFTASGPDAFGLYIPPEQRVSKDITPKDSTKLDTNGHAKKVTPKKIKKAKALPAPVAPDTTKTNNNEPKQEQQQTIAPMDSKDHGTKGPGTPLLLGTAIAVSLFSYALWELRKAKSVAC